MKSTFRAVILSGAFATLGFAMACGGGSQSTVAPSPSTGPASSPGTSPIATDAALFKLLAQIDPFGSYSLFPNADAILSGTPFHGPMDRVSMNAKAFAALQNGKLPPGTRFPDGSVIFKEIITNRGTTTTYSVLYKDAGNQQAADGWLWAEFSPSGTVGYSINNRGAVCTSCHSAGQGATNDFVRTFERQH